MSNVFQGLIRRLTGFCNKINADLVIRYYGTHEVCFKAMTEDDTEIFSVIVGYPIFTSSKKVTKITKEELSFYTTRRAIFDINSGKDEYTGGQFRRDDMELLLSIDDLNDEELGLEKPDYTKYLKDN